MRRDRVMPGLRQTLDPMAPVVFGLGQRVKVVMRSCQVVDRWLRSRQEPVPTTQVQELGNNPDPMTWGAFFRGFSKDGVGFGRADLP